MEDTRRERGRDLREGRIMCPKEKRYNYINGLKS